MPAYHLQHAESHSAQLGIGEIGADDGQISSHILVRCGVQILTKDVHKLHALYEKGYHDAAVLQDFLCKV